MWLCDESWRKFYSQGSTIRSPLMFVSYSYVKQSISQAPNNASAWNYLRGVLDHSHTPYSTLQPFVQLYAVPHSPGETVAEVIDLENPLPSKDSQLPCPAAIEFLADIYELEGDNSIPKATEVHRNALSRTNLSLMKVVVMEVTGKRARYHSEKVCVIRVPMWIFPNFVY